MLKVFFYFCAFFNQYLDISLVQNMEIAPQRSGPYTLAQEDENGSDDYLKYLTLAAPPSSQAAHYLARTMILRSLFLLFQFKIFLRFGSLLEGQSKNVGLETLEDALKTSALGTLAANLNHHEENRHSTKASFFLPFKHCFYGHNLSSFFAANKIDHLKNNPLILQRK